MTQDAEHSGSSETAQSAADSIIIPIIKIDVFSIEPATRSVIEYTAADRRLSQCHWRFHDGGVDGAIELYKTEQSPNLILLENNDNREKLFPALERLAEECRPETKVIILSSQNDVNLYRDLLETGVTDELTTPFGSMVLVDAIARAWEEEGQPRLGRLIAFIGGRGGSGSSTVAQNVAAALAQWHETPTLLADLDLQFGTVGINFDVDGSYGMNDILRSASRLDEVLLNRTALQYSKNLEILASEPNLDRVGDVHGGAIERLIEIAQTTERTVILDMPNTWTHRSRRALISADQIFITATPDLSSLRNTKIIAEFLRQARPNDSMPVLVLNQVNQPKRPEIPSAEFAEAVRLEEGPIVPYNASLFGHASNIGQVVTAYSEKSRHARIFRKIAEEVLSPGIHRRKLSISGRMLNFLRRWW